MRLIQSFSAILALVSLSPSFCDAQRVRGRPEGFAAGTTGGGNAPEVFPKSNAELANFLKDDTPRVIVLDREFNFVGTEGRTRATGCAPWSTKPQCQLAINGANNWCGREQPNAPKVQVDYDNAGLQPLVVGSHKSIVGVGNQGKIRGKGLRVNNGARNVIIQNIEIYDLNPQYVWGGDAIVLNGADNVWIDHCKIRLIGRQMIVMGGGPSGRVSITLTEFDGRTPWSASCNGQQYWGMFFTGSNDLITMKMNYIHDMGGRAPKVTGNTLLHLVNNYFYQMAATAVDLGAPAMILAEGNTFQNVKTPLTITGGRIFTSPSPDANKVCFAGLGRACQMNAFGSSGPFNGNNNGDFIVNFKGYPVARASTAGNSRIYIDANAGVGRLR